MGLFLLHARTHLKHLNTKKEISPAIRVVSVTRRFVIYGIRAGSTLGLGFSMAFIDMIRFDCTVVDRVDYVCAGNHG